MKKNKKNFFETHDYTVFIGLLYFYGYYSVLKEFSEEKFVYKAGTRCINIWIFSSGQIIIGLETENDCITLKDFMYSAVSSPKVLILEKVLQTLKSSIDYLTF